MVKGRFGLIGVCGLLIFKLYYCSLKSKKRQVGAVLNTAFDKTASFSRKTSVKVALLDGFC